MSPQPTQLFDGKRVLITGGTGSLGKTLVRRLLETRSAGPDRIVVMSRDEAKQHQMRVDFAQRLASTDEIVYDNFRRRLQFRIGDVRDYDAVSLALRDIDVVIHAAAMKQDFDYVPDHPMAAAYRLYHDAYQDQPSWDLTSVLWAVRPDRGYFGLSEAGTVTYDDKGFTQWKQDAAGKHRYLTVDAAQTERVKEILAALASEPPH